MTTEQAWCIYFAGIVSMERHPGKRRDGDKPLTIKQCAILADIMIDEHRTRWTEDKQCPG